MSAPAEVMQLAPVDGAFDLAARGWRVFPVPPGTKKSHKSAKRSGGRNWGNTTDPAEIKADWARWPKANVGIACGEESGLLVVEIDTIEGHGVDGIAEFQKLIDKHGPLPETVEAISPSGSIHHYFKWPEGVEIHNSESRIAPGVDVRGEGGMVIAPPSIKPGNPVPYRWRKDPAFYDLADCPAWLIELAMKKPKPKKAAEPANDRQDDDERVLAMLYERPNNLSRPDWVRVGLALKHHFGDRAKDAFLSFSSRYSGAITEGEAERQWETSSPTGEVRLGTVVKLLGGHEHRSSTFQNGGAWKETIDPDTGEIIESNLPKPVDIFRRYSTPELPADLLPATIENFARKHGEIMGVDPAGLAMAALAVCSAAITDEIAVQVKRNDPSWREPARLWVGLVGAPSMKKTPILKAATAPLRKIDANLMRAYMSKVADYEALGAKERKAAEKPRQERRMISDATIEAAQEVLKDSPRGVLSTQDELSGWFGSMDKYSPGKGAMADRGFWLQAYNGGPYSLNRIARGACYIPNCSIGLLGGIQPEPIRAIANDSHDDGLIQRLLPVILRTGNVGRDVPSDGVVTAYERLIERLEVMRPPTRSSIAYGEKSACLQFDDTARAVRERLEGEHLDLVRALETISPKLAAHYGKFDGLFARLCVLWHCIETEQGTQPAELISGHTAERVAKFMADFIRPSSIAFYAGLLGMSAGHEDVIALASWIVAEGLDEVKARDVQSSSQSFRHYTADQVRTLCEKLEAFGWGEWGEPPRNSNKPPFLVNPMVHSMFADRGAEERERRAQHREMIHHALKG